MKKLSLIMGALMISISSISQTTISVNEEISTPSEKRIQAKTGTYQLIFKDEPSKEWFFSSGIELVSEAIGVGGIATFEDLLIVIGENRLQSEEQEYKIGQNNEVTIKVLSLDFINSSQYKPLKEIIIQQ